MAEKLYRVKAGAGVHYINNLMVEEGQTTTLPEGCEPGPGLELVKASKKSGEVVESGDPAE